jgi:hypothetical protein
MNFTPVPRLARTLAPPTLFRATKLFAPRFLDWNFGKVRRQFVRLEILNLECNQALKRHAKVHRTVRAIHNGRRANYIPAVRADNINRFLDPAALSRLLNNG